ncbi:hypothetical protein Y1Q_0014648 [Alligator mississippiensis]|uniref:Uncharacterized protein n=1 Tax=Alligator mississippiensis TaxID=8496 RepID=A0A151P819_ALLMI|nr:hypothetical protein Y1Q_0014648 [Alligator mississippiensis]
MWCSAQEIHRRESLPEGRDGRWIEQISVWESRGSRTADLICSVDRSDKAPFIWTLPSDVLAGIIAEVLKQLS